MPYQVISWIRGQGTNRENGQAVGPWELSGQSLDIGREVDSGIKVLQHEHSLFNIPIICSLAGLCFGGCYQRSLHRRDICQKEMGTDGKGEGNGGLAQLDCFTFRNYGVGFYCFETGPHTTQVDLDLLILLSQAPKL